MLASQVQCSRNICPAAKQTNKWQVPDDASSDEEDASPYLPYHHEPLAFEWSSSSESEDVDGPSLDVE